MLLLNLVGECHLQTLLLRTGLLIKLNLLCNNTNSVIKLVNLLMQVNERCSILQLKVENISFKIQRQSKSDTLQKTNSLN